MHLAQFYDLYQEEKISKRLYWALARERFLPLLEYQKLMQKNPSCNEIVIRPDGITLEAEGIKLFFDMTQNICRAETMLIGTETEDFTLMRTFVPNGGVVFDIGANIGRISLGLAKEHPDCTIYAFEPVQGTFEGLCRNLRLNGAAEQIHAYHMGFFSERGNLKFFVPPANEAASLRPLTDLYYLRESNVGQGAIGERLDEVICPVDTLDHFVREHKIECIDFIKCDTEGAEKMVFDGGEYVFTKLQPAVYTEMLRKHAARFGYHPNEIIEMFKGWGYDCYAPEGQRLLPFVEMDEETRETNFFFLHREKHRALLEGVSG